jgi:hypothetical protein
MNDPRTVVSPEEYEIIALRGVVSELLLAITDASRAILSLEEDALGTITVSDGSRVWKTEALVAGWDAATRRALLALQSRPPAP